MAKLTVTQQRQETLDKAEGFISEAVELLESLWVEMDEIKGNMEEKFSETERFQRLEELVDSLDTAKADLETVQGSLPSDMQYT